MIACYSIDHGMLLEIRLGKWLHGHGNEQTGNRLFVKGNDRYRWRNDGIT